MMAEAMMKGMLSAGRSPSSIAAFDVFAPRLEEVKAALNVETTAELEQVILPTC